MTRPPLVYSSLERAIMRVLFGLVVALHIPIGLPFRDLPAPNGLGRLIDLHFLLDARLYAAGRYLLYGAVIFYVLRIGWLVVLPYMTLFSCAVGSMINSQGAISHHLQIVSLVLLAQTAAHFFTLRGKGERETRVISWSQQTIAATYLVAGLTKLVQTSGAWILQTPFLAVQIVKTTEQDFQDALDPSRAGQSLAVAEWVAAHPGPVMALMGLTLMLELCAPIVLLGRIWAAVYGGGLLILHEGIQRIMKLDFLYNEYLVWIYLVNLPFWLLLCWRSRAVER